MKLRVLALVLVGIVLLVWLARDTRDLASARGTEAPTAPPPSAEPKPPAPPPALQRDPFRYAGERRPGAPPAVRDLALAPEPFVAPPPALPARNTLRVAGFVRRAGVLRAALSLDGEVVLAAVGQEAHGHKVLAMDEDLGVTLQGPEGKTLVLKPGEQP